MGHLKKYLKKRCNIDPSPLISDFLSNQAIPEFNHQHDYFLELLDPMFLDPLLQELASTMFVDANHGHDSVADKVITGFLTFAANSILDWGSSRQASV